MCVVTLCTMIACNTNHVAAEGGNETNDGDEVAPRERRGRDHAINSVIRRIFTPPLAAPPPERLLFDQGMSWPNAVARLRLWVACRTASVDETTLAGLGTIVQ